MSSSLQSSSPRARPPTPSWVVETPLTFALKTGKSDLARYILSINSSFADISNSKGETPFQLAVRSDLHPIPGNAASIVQLLLDRAKEPSSALSALHLAASRTDPVALGVLLGHRPKLFLDVRDSAGRTPLHETVVAGKFENFLSLLENGANIAIKDNCKRNALHLACDNQGGEPFVRELIKRGVPLNEPDSNGETPLIIALKRKEAVKARLLLEAGADPICFSKEGAFSLSCAVLLGDEFLEFFLNQRQLDLNLRIGGCSVGGLALAAACRYGLKTAVERLLQKGVSPRDNSSCLVEATKNSHWEVVSLLLEGEIDLNVVDRASPHDNLLGLAIWNRKPSVARRFIERGVDIHYRNQRGESSLHIALKQMDLEMFEFLLSQGVSPCSLMQETEHGDAFPFGLELLPERVFSALVVHWGSPASNRNLLYLLAAVCKYEKPIQEALDKGFLLGEADKYGATPLCIASNLLNVSTIEILLKHSKAEVNRPNQFGRTPLATLFFSMLGAQRNTFPSNISRGICPTAELKETVRLLLAAGADPDHVNPFDKSTPRSLAKELKLEGLLNVSDPANGSTTSSSSSTGKEPLPSVSKKKRAAAAKTKSVSRSKKKKLPKDKREGDPSARLP